MPELLNVLQHMLIAGMSFGLKQDLLGLKIEN